MRTPDHCTPCLSRRSLLTALTAGAALGLTGCAVYGEAAAPAAGSPPSTPTGGAAPPSGGPEAIAAVADIPVGGGLVLAAGLVVTRPAEDDVRAFTAICTHAGCGVNEVSDGLIRCPCHGSTFDITTGEPRNGPATRPLETVAVTVTGPDVVRG